MRNPLISALTLVLAAARVSLAASPFDDAAVAWHMSDVQAQGSLAPSSALRAEGAARLGVALQGEDRQASLRRGGDGRAAQLDGGWLSAEEGEIASSKPWEKAATIAVRVQVPGGKWQGVILGKFGAPSGDIFSISAENRGGRDFLLGHFGSDEIAGTHEVLAELAEPDSATWHDVVL